MHVRVRSMRTGKYGWCCETCESVVMDNDGYMPVRKGEMR